MQPGIIDFPAIERIVYGRPAADALTKEAERLGASRVYLMVSRTMNRTTDEVEKIRRALGNKCGGVFDRIPAHSPRQAVIAAAEQARAVEADLIITAGGGSVTDAAKAVCGGCAVIVDCRDYALETRQPFGVWGGLDEEERRSLWAAPDRALSLG